MYSRFAQSPMVSIGTEFESVHPPIQDLYLTTDGEPRHHDYVTLLPELTYEHFNISKTGYQNSTIRSENFSSSRPHRAFTRDRRICRQRRKIFRSVRCVRIRASH